MQRHHSLPFGAEPSAEGVRFRIWAPHAGRVAVELDHAGAQHLPMARESGGWFSLTTKSAAAGSRYRYRVDGRPFPDPASRCQPLGVHGPSEVVDPAQYEWRDLGWRGRSWEEIVLYELHLGTFSETGDCDGAVRHLDHIRDLGATAVQLMPVAAFPGNHNWGYDGVFLFAPTAQYGRPEALKRLVEACHERGLAIFLDVVYNHFGPEGNYLPAIAAEFFDPQHQTPWGAAIDFSGPRDGPVRRFFVENALYWLDEFQFDGLRLDAVHAIDDDGVPDIADEIAETVRHRIQGREIHLVLENDRNEARRLIRCGGRPRFFTAQWNDDLHHVLHLLTAGETSRHYGDFADDPATHLGRALAEGLAYQGQPSAFRGGRPRGEPSAQLPPTAFIGFLQNHDQVGNHPRGMRLTARAGEAERHAAIAIILLAPQIPLLFMGEEWASLRPFAFFCDLEPALAEAVREGRRREFAHFAEAGKVIPDPTAVSSFTMSRLGWDEIRQPDHRRWLARYGLLLSIRTREIVPRLVGIPPLCGRFSALGARSVRVEWRLGDGSLLRLIANFSDRPLPPADAAAFGRMIYSTDRLGAPLSATFFLRPASTA
jgi:malto-oligosyltrehalose trehalohydrolase